MTPLKLGSTIGIIGGGQLARMLCMAAARLGFKTIVLEPQQNCPAAQVANHHIAAAYDDKHALQFFAERADVVTYEFENLPIAAVDFISQSTRVSPCSKALAVSQDRVGEKAFLNQSGIKTTPWCAIDNVEELDAALLKFKRGILKTRRFGYDGKGQIRLAESGRLTASDALSEIGHSPAIFEAMVDFTTEISVIAARDYDGYIEMFDIAENIHRQGILHQSQVPANISPKTVELAHNSAITVLNALDYVGILGVEFFVLDDDTVVVNEIAPRVHNSGHWTEAACLISQFEQHIRAVAGWPLGSPQRHSDCIMENLIGDEILQLPEIAKEPQSLINIYGKDDIRQGRKMGHVTRLTPRTKLKI